MTDKSAEKSASITYVTSMSAGHSSTLQFPTPAPWLATVQRRLTNSIGPVEPGASPGGQWLSGDVVRAANSWFQATSDMLPNEPFLHSSAQGNLVAEFTGVNGPMTVVVTTSHALAMATINGQPVQHQMSLAAAQPATMRADLATLTDALRGQHHGPLDPKG
jgi:hypothetical protein